MHAKLRIGKIPYLNLAPIFHVLQKECDCMGYEFVEGYPAALNKMLREGNIDVSPSSSIEYLRDESAYGIIEGHSISSHGPVESILLFSRLPLKELKGREVFVTHQSETSAALLEIIFRKFHRIDCEIVVSNMPSNEALKFHSAYLAIGDDALRAARIAQNIAEECPETGCRFLRFGLTQYFVYDLGEIWQGFTGLPFVYALWIARKDIPGEKRELLERFIRDLGYAKSEALKKLPELAPRVDAVIPPERVAEYWKLISYDLDEKHMEGLGMFKRYLEELGLLKSS
jgi:chorismate dehydratase